MFTPDHWVQRVQDAGFVYNEEHDKRIGWTRDAEGQIEVWAANFYPHQGWVPTRTDLQRAGAFILDDIDTGKHQSSGP